jgi:hypothetical protein
MSRTTYILGAGFSSYAGLPLQSEFTDALLAARENERGPSRALVQHLEQFVHRTFGHADGANATRWPTLEDMFTCIDLTANTGHHLGPEYSPRQLRTTRRVLLVRIMRMLHQKYSYAVETEISALSMMKRFLSSADFRKSSFVSLNWDVSLEAVAEDCYPGLAIAYGRGIHPATLDSNEGVLRRKTESSRTRLSVTKMHGSVNWLYCDCCRNVFWFPPAEVPRIADQILSKEEWALIRGSESSKARWKCPECRKVELGTRIATFSYRKALEFPMFQISWLRAEEALRRSRRWVLIGYSMPSADFEFKQLLKRIQLAKGNKLEIIVVTGGSAEAAEKTRENYVRFFGAMIRERKTFFRDGLALEVLNRIL